MSFHSPAQALQGSRLTQAPASPRGKPPAAVGFHAHGVCPPPTSLLLSPSLSLPSHEPPCRFQNVQAELPPSPASVLTALPPNSPESLLRISAGLNLAAFPTRTPPSLHILKPGTHFGF